MSNASAEPKTTEAATTVKPTMVCPECGYRGKPMLVEGVPSCPKCGNDMQPMAAVPPAPAAKAGARHSKNDMALLTEIRDAARAIDADAVALGAEEQVEPPEPGEAPPAPSAKAGGVPAATDAPLIWGAHRLISTC